MHSNFSLAITFNINLYKSWFKKIFRYWQAESYLIFFLFVTIDSLKKNLYEQARLVSKDKKYDSPLGTSQRGQDDTVSLKDLKINRVLHFRENKKHDELRERKKEGEWRRVVSLGSSGRIVYHRASEHTRGRRSTVSN